MTGRVVLIVACVVFAGIVPAQAQDRPVVFVHGLNSSGSTWEDTANRLRQQLAIVAERPSLSGSSYGDQADNLQAQLYWLPDTTVAVGHSNGGIVSRHWSGIHPLSGILTLSTPNQGAPIFAHVADWVNFNLLAFDLIGNIGAAFGGSYDDMWWVYAAIQSVLNVATQSAREAILQIGGLLALHQWLPIFPEMIPGSGYLTALNSSGNLAREAGAVPSRVGIVNVAHNFYVGGAFRTVWPQQGDAISSALNASAALLDYYAMQLWTSQNPRDWTRAQRLSTLAWWFWSHEEIWCRSISDPSPGAYSSAGFCAENDTLVPAWSQAYPGATNIGVRNTPAHVEQTQTMDSVLYNVLTTFMHVYPRGAAPPPPPPTQNPPGTPSPPPAPPSGRDTLYPGEWLEMQQELDSENGRYALAYQPDGNLVLYRDDGKPLWSSKTSGTSAGAAAMQEDGNFVIYNADGVPVWASNTGGYPGATVSMQSDGNVVIYTSSGAPIWATGTSGW